MNYNLMPTLEHIALINVSTTLWNKHEVRTLVRNFSNCKLFSKVESDLFIHGAYPSNRKKLWLKIENIVTDMVSQLTISAILKDKLLQYIQPVGLQILRWMEYHYRIYVLDLPNEFCWTPQGVIDRKKTAEMLIKDESLHVDLRYKLACLYCFEEDIPILWNRIPESTKLLFFDIDDFNKLFQQGLLGFWTFHVIGELRRLDNMIRERFNRNYSPKRYAFRLSAETGNIVATKYFLQQITLSNEALVNTATRVAKKRHDCFRKITDSPKEYYSDVLFFLLTEMNHEEQEKILLNCPYDTLNALLDWPWQIYLVETATHVFDFLDVNKYHMLLSTIVAKVIKDHRDYNYQKLFGELWRKIPDSHKKNIVSNGIFPSIMSLLFQVRDLENAKLMIQDLSIAERKDLFFSLRGKLICADLIQNEEYDFLKYFVRLCVTTLSEVMELKELCREQRSPPFLSDFHKQRTVYLYLILEEISKEKFCNRNREDEDDSNTGSSVSSEIDSEGDSSTAKRHRTADEIVKEFFNRINKKEEDNNTGSSEIEDDSSTAKRPCTSDEIGKELCKRNSEDDSSTAKRPCTSDKISKEFCKRNSENEDDSNIAQRPCTSDEISKEFCKRNSEDDDDSSTVRKPCTSDEISKEFRKRNSGDESDSSTAKRACTSD